MYPFLTAYSTLNLLASHINDYWYLEHFLRGELLQVYSAWERVMLTQPCNHSEVHVMMSPSILVPTQARCGLVIVHTADIGLLV